MGDKEAKRLLKAADPVLAELAKGALTEEGIPCYMITRGAGAVYGGGFYGADLYVPEADFDRASDVLAGLTAGELSPEDEAQRSAMEGLGLLSDD